MANCSISSLYDKAVIEAIASLALGEVAQASCKPSFLSEADAAATKADIERVVRRVLSKELDAAVLKAVKKELKSQDYNDAVVGVTSKALAKFFEIMFTRKSTWISQLKGSKV